MTPDFDADPARELRELLAVGRFRDALELHARTDAAAVRRRPEVQLLAATAATRVGDLAAGGMLAAESLERFRQRADDDGRARAVNLLGAIAFERGDLASAERCFAEALELAHASANPLLAAHASNNLASVADLQGRRHEALGLFRSALLSYQRLGDRRGAAQTQHNLGLAYRQLGDLAQAESAVSEAVRHAEVEGNPALVALAMSGRAEVAIANGELDLAARELHRAALLAVEGGDEIGAAEVERLQAVVELRRGAWREALAHADRANEVAARYGSLLLEAESGAVAALALRAAGRVEDAETRRREVLDAFDRLGAADLATRFNEEWSQRG
jgi:tetratricopeptide (TPR) repeat protein